VTKLTRIPRIVRERLRDFNECDLDQINVMIDEQRFFTLTTRARYRSS